MKPLLTMFALAIAFVGSATDCHAQYTYNYYTAMPYKTNAANALGNLVVQKSDAVNAKDAATLAKSQVTALIQQLHACGGIPQENFDWWEDQAEIADDLMLEAASHFASGGTYEATATSKKNSGDTKFAFTGYDEAVGLYQQSISASVLGENEYDSATTKYQSALGTLNALKLDLNESLTIYGCQ